MQKKKKTLVKVFELCVEVLKSVYKPTNTSV